MKKRSATRHARDVELSRAVGQDPFLEPHAGKKGQISPEKVKKLSRAMTRFVESVRAQEPEKTIKRRYRIWRKHKMSIRGHVSRKVWADFIEMMGEQLDLPDIGSFSKEHFRKS